MERIALGKRLLGFQLRPLLNPTLKLRVGRISQQVDELTSKFVKFLVSYHSYLWSTGIIFTLKTHSRAQMFPSFYGGSNNFNCCIHLLLWSRRRNVRFVITPPLHKQQILINTAERCDNESYLFLKRKRSLFARQFAICEPLFIVTEVIFCKNKSN